MRCTECDITIDPSHVYIFVMYCPTPYVVNLHPRCMQNLLGKHGWDALTKLTLVHGWHQLVPPGVDVGSR